MSHIVRIQTQIRDRAAVEAACHRLNLAEPQERSVALFSSEVTGLAVQLPDWRYPVVCELASGQIHYDNFQGRWGELSQLDRLLQMYAVEKSKLEARKAGHTVTEQPLAGGAVRLTIQVAGSAA